MASRVGRNPITLPKGVDVKLDGQKIAVKGSKGQLDLEIHSVIGVSLEGNVLQFQMKEESIAANAMMGTMRALTNNLVKGVHEGFERKLKLVGVGYRAQTKGNVLNLTLGFSHPIDYEIPAGITIETPTQTEITVRGIDKQLVGSVAAKIRSYRPPEPYKGKGVCYADERIIRKETKKK